MIKLKDFTEFEPIEFEKIKVPFGFFDYADIYKSFLINIADEKVKEATIVEIGSWVGKSTLYMAELIEYFLDKRVSPETKSIKFINIDPFVADITINNIGGYEWNESTEGTKKATKEAFYNNVKTHKKFIETREEYSPLAAEKFENESIDCIWVDALHDYDSVLKDLNAWYPKVKKGGILGGHDFNYDFGGVPKAVHDFCVKNALTYTVKHKSFTIFK
jgi:SAM-dependent methyltransferase